MMMSSCVDGLRKLMEFKSRGIWRHHNVTADGEPVQFRAPHVPQMAYYEKQLSALFRKIVCESRSPVDARCIESVFVCFTNRSGSNYLCDLLANCGVLPKVKESFNAPLIASFIKDKGITSFEEFCRQLLKRGSVPGLFASKVGLIQLALLSQTGILGGVFANPKFIYVRRNDILGQAISFSIADQTKSWTSKQAPRTAPNFDRRDICKRIAGLAAANAKWEEFFGLNGLSPYRVIYEDLVEQPQPTIAGIAAWLGVESNQCPITGSTLKRQANDINLEWRREFLSTQRAL